LLLKYIPDTLPGKLARHLDALVQSQIVFEVSKLRISFVNEPLVDPIGRILADANAICCKRSALVLGNSIPNYFNFDGIPVLKSRR